MKVALFLKYFPVIFLLLSTPTFACPVIIDTTGQKDKILADLASADSYSKSQTAVNAIWSYWHRAPDDQAQEWLNEGVERIRYGDLEKAQQVLTSLVEYCPQYAEGYNQLAFAQFMVSNFDASEKALQKAIDLEPSHFGAIAGRGLVEHARGNIALAKIWITKAVKVHPFLNERFILDIAEDGDAL